MNTTNQYESLIKSNMTTSSQSDFKTGDLYINQIIPITNEIYKSLDVGYKVRGVFLIYQKHLTKYGK